MNKIVEEPFGTLPNGDPVQIYTLTNADGGIVKISNFGGIITNLILPTDRGTRDVVVGFDNIDGYIHDQSYQGAIIGRYANRIANGRFSIDDKEFKLEQNNGSNNLHGGPIGFDKALWQAKIIDWNGLPALKLEHLSPDGDQGFPGKLVVTVIYQWTDDDELIIDYSAKTDLPTIINLTNHSYFNLDGHGAGSILDHSLRIDAQQYSRVDKRMIPKRRAMNVKGTPFDFTSMQKIGGRIENQHRQIKNGNGYDHNYIVNDYDGSLRPIAWVKSSDEQVEMTVSSTEPGIQLYTGNFLSIKLGKDGYSYGRRDAFCLETQHFPDSPNRPDFPSTVLRPGQQYQSQTTYKFIYR